MKLTSPPMWKNWRKMRLSKRRKKRFTRLGNFTSRWLPRLQRLASRPMGLGVPFSSDPISGATADVGEAEEVNEASEEEAELEEAQAEAEALLDLEGRSDDTIDARVEVRAPAADAALRATAPRPAQDRTVRSWTSWR